MPRARPCRSTLPDLPEAGPLWTVCMAELVRAVRVAGSVDAEHQPYCVWAPADASLLRPQPLKRLYYRHIPVAEHAYRYIPRHVQTPEDGVGCGRPTLRHSVSMGFGCGAEGASFVRRRLHPAGTHLMESPVRAPALSVMISAFLRRRRANHNGAMWPSAFRPWWNCKPGAPSPGAPMGRIDFPEWLVQAMSFRPRGRMPLRDTGESRSVVPCMDGMARPSAPHLAVVPPPP